jgi:monothiol glutaredoxin
MVATRKEAMSTEYFDNNPHFDLIRTHLEDNDIVLYMKGTASMPQDGYSAAIVQILNTLGVAYRDIDVVNDHELRQAVKDFANWSSTPQLYVQGDFIGGCDIVREMYATGKLQKLLVEKGLLSPAAIIPR